MRSTSPRVLSVAFALALLLGACGSEDSDVAADGVASLDTGESDTGGSDAADGNESDEADEELSTEEAALAFSSCMRDEGLDFADVGVDAEGRIDLRSGFDSVDFGSEEFRDAMDVCQPLLGDGGFGAGGRAGIGENVEIQDALIEFSACIRDEGFEVGDITLGGQPGGPPPGEGDGPADGEGRGDGQRQQGFGDISGRLATQLGLDIEDPDVAAAIDLCSPVLDAAFAEQAIGQP